MTTAVAPTTATTPPPAASASATSTAQTTINAGQSSLSSSYSTFLTLLTTQLKNQDPTAPLDTNAFTQELVSLTGVQQQLLTNQLLNTLVGASSNGGVAGAVGLIGENATATSSTAALSGGKADWTYTLPSDAAGATATVSDSSGQVVFSGALSDLSTGQHSFEWNGKSQTGAAQVDGGTYTLSIAAAAADGSQISPVIGVTGKVAAVQQVNGQTLVKIGPTQVPLSSITTVTPS